MGPAIPSLLANPGLKMDKELGQLKNTLDLKRIDCSNFSCLAAFMTRSQGCEVGEGAVLGT